MLNDQLFNIRSFNPGDQGDCLTASVVLNPGHPLFEGHFPGNPILPGVCTLQIAKELLEKLLGREIMLKKALNIKYLGFVNPLTQPEMLFTITLTHGTESTMPFSATVSAEGNAVCSFRGEYGEPS